MTTPTRPEPLTAAQRRLITLVVIGGILIAGIGFAGSYMAVSDLANAKHFGWFSRVFPIGVDAGIAVMLALDLVLTSLRMPFPLLRHTAWFLTAATVAFNASAAWGDWLAVGMHATIPALFIVTMEAARHAVGRLANIVADRHIESPPLIRWILSPIGTYVIWRRQRVWQIASYAQVIAQQRELRVFRAQLRKDHGRRWRREAPAEKLLVFELARFGISVSEALAMPETEAEAQRKAEAERAAEARRNAEAETEARRVEESKRRAEAEARRLAEAETEAKLAEIESNRRLAEAEAEARLAEVERKKLLAEAEAEAERRRIADQQRQQEAEAELRRQQEATALAMQAAEAETRRLAEAEAIAQRAREAEAEALRLAQQRLRLQEQQPGPQRQTATGDRTPNPKPKPAAEVNPKPPAEIGSRRARIEAEVDALVSLMRTEGYDAVDLKRAISELNLKQTTAFDRLVKAQTKWAENAA